MTTNHPAHGPVSLERLSLNDAIAHADERADALFGPCAAQHAQLAAWLRELQERRKADSAEPIGWTDAEELRSVERDGCGYLFKANPITPHADPLRVIKLYAVPPAPVVPEEIDVNDPALDTHRKWMAEGWNRCRAAMLQAGNSPVIGIDLASEPDRSVEVRYLAPPGYVMVPKEPTNEMLNAWLSEIANWRGHVAGYKAMLAAAPLQAEEPAQKK